MERRTSTLALAVRVPVVAKYTGQLAVALSGLLLPPLVVAAASGAWRVALAGGIVLALLLAAGGRAASLPAVNPIQRNEALAVTALAFVLGAASLVPLFVADGLALTDAVFEATSAVTTTGLSTTGTVEGRSAAFLFTRAWGQWYGGLAIVVLAVAIVVEPGVAARRIAMGSDTTDVLTGTRTWARGAMKIYAALTAAAVALLVVVLDDPFDAVVHALAAVSTGGFGSHDASLSALGGFPTQAAVLACAMAGAVSLSVYPKLWRGRWRELARDETLRALAWSMAGAILLLSVTMAWAGDGSWPGALADASILGASAHSTVGFTSRNPAELDAASKLVLMGAMTVGGDVGSTAGGIKILRALVVFRLLWLGVVRNALPQHAVVGIRVEGHPVSDGELRACVSLAVLFVTVIVLSWYPFLALGYPPLDSLFEITSAVGTVGLSTGVASPSLEGGLKLLLCLDMLLGRLEVVALLVLLYPRTWIGRRVSHA